MTSLLDDHLVRRLQVEVADAQRRWRAPAVSVGVVRDGELAWSMHVGSARLDPPTRPSDDTQVLVGSITKTFTALLVLQLRDEGRLHLDDPAHTWLDHTAHGDLTVRQLLSHCSGLQREPVGRVWESSRMPDARALLADLGSAEAVLPPWTAFHYSNLGYGLLGRLVERLLDRPWEDALRERVLDPLGLTRTGLTPQEDHAYGYVVHPFAGTATREPEVEFGVMAPVGGLWSCVADMARYAAFLAEPDPAVLSPATLDEMSRPAVLVDLEGWTSGFGLGLELVRSGDRVYVGHRGAVPGFLTGLRVHRRERTAVFAVATTSAGAQPGPLATKVLDAVLDDTPRQADPWVPERAVPELDELLGSWWSEGEELVLEVRDGALWMRVVEGTPQDDTRFEAEAPDVFRAVQGRERGERLELVRTEDGRLDRLYFATYRVTRGTAPA